MQGIRHTNGSQACMEPHMVLSVVSKDVDILVVRGDERSHEEISEGISTVPGKNNKNIRRNIDSSWQKYGPWTSIKHGKKS